MGKLPQLYLLSSSHCLWHISVNPMTSVRQNKSKVNPAVLWVSEELSPQRQAWDAGITSAGQEPGPCEFLSLPPSTSSENGGREQTSLRTARPGDLDRELL